MCTVGPGALVSLQGPLHISAETRMEPAVLTADPLVAFSLGSVSPGACKAEHFWWQPPSPRL